MHSVFALCTQAEDWNAPRSSYVLEAAEPSSMFYPWVNRLSQTVTVNNFKFTLDADFTQFLNSPTLDGIVSMAASEIVSIQLRLKLADKMHPFIFCCSVDTSDICSIPLRDRLSVPLNQRQTTTTTRARVGSAVLFVRRLLCGSCAVSFQGAMPARGDVVRDGEKKEMH